MTDAPTATSRDPSDATVRRNRQYGCPRQPCGGDDDPRPRSCRPARRLQMCACGATDFPPPIDPSRSARRLRCSARPRSGGPASPRRALGEFRRRGSYRRGGFVGQRWTSCAECRRPGDSRAREPGTAPPLPVRAAVQNPCSQALFSFATPAHSSVTAQSLPNREAGPPAQNRKRSVPRHGLFRRGENGIAARMRGEQVAQVDE